MVIFPAIDTFDDRSVVTSVTTLNLWYCAPYPAEAPGNRVV